MQQSETNKQKAAKILAKKKSWKNLPLVNARVVLKFCAATAIASMAIQIAVAAEAATLEQHTLQHGSSNNNNSIRQGKSLSQSHSQSQSQSP